MPKKTYSRKARNEFVEGEMVEATQSIIKIVESILTDMADCGKDIEMLV